MASRSFHDLFLRARDQFAGSSRWLYFAALALAILHVTIVTPFVEGSRVELETISEHRRLAAVERGLGEVRPALEAIRRETTSALEPILERLVEDLERDLDRLTATHRKYASESADTEPGDADGEADGSTAAAEALIRDEPPRPGIEPFMLDDPDWIADLRDAQTREQLLAAFAPLVEELVVAPRFFDVEGTWKDAGRPRLESRLDQAAGALPRLRGRFPEAQERWDALVGALAGLGRAAQQMSFEKPPEPYWWTASTPGEAIELGLSEATRGGLRRPSTLVRLQAAAEETDRRYQEVTEQIDLAKRELAELPAASTLSGLDLEALVAMFPLLLGMVLGGGAVWRSQRLRELGFTTRLAIEHGGPVALRRWFWSQIQWRTAAGTSAAAAWQWCVLQTLLGYLLAMTWIALAAVQLRRLETFDRRRLMFFAIAGAAVVLFAVVHRLLVARRAITRLDVDVTDLTVEQMEEPVRKDSAARRDSDQSDSSDIDSDDDSENSGYLDVRALRR